MPRPPYFVRSDANAARETWQLVGGSGSLLTAPRTAADDGWRAHVLAAVKSQGVRVMSGGRWIGRVTADGAFVPFNTNPQGGDE